MGMQIWRWHKKVKGHPWIIIWTNAVDLEFPMLYTKIQPQSFLSSEEDFEEFFFFIQIWLRRRSCSMVQNNLNKLMIPLQQKDYTFSKEGPVWNLVKISQAVSKMKMFKYHAILYRYIAQGQITPGGQNTDCN